MTRFTASLVNHEGPEKSGPSAFCGDELSGGLNVMDQLGPDLRMSRVPDVSDCHGALLAPGQHLSRRETVPGRDTLCACRVSRLDVPGRDTDAALLASDHHLSRFTTVPGRDTGRACWVSRAGTVSAGAQPRFHSGVPGRDTDAALLASDHHQSRHTRVPDRDTDTALLASDHHLSRFTTVPGRDTGRACWVSRAGTVSARSPARFHSGVPGRDNGVLITPRSTRRLQS